MAEEEDARLLMQQTVNDSNLDYSGLTKKVLVYCNQTRSIEDASPIKSPKKNRG